MEKELGYPCFVKPANLGSSVGITKARTRDELLAGLHQAAVLDTRFSSSKASKPESWNAPCWGVGVLQASVVGEIRFDADWYDYETKYTEGRSQTLIPAPFQHR